MRKLRMGRHGITEPLRSPVALCSSRSVGPSSRSDTSPTALYVMRTPLSLPLLRIKVSAARVRKRRVPFPPFFYLSSSHFLFPSSEAVIFLFFFVLPSLSSVRTRSSSFPPVPCVGAHLVTASLPSLSSSPRQMGRGWCHLRRPSVLSPRSWRGRWSDGTRIWKGKKKRKKGTVVVVVAYSGRGRRTQKRSAIGGATVRQNCTSLGYRIYDTWAWGVGREGKEGVANFPDRQTKRERKGSCLKLKMLVVV